jgi:hypothetical protein
MELYEFYAHEKTIRFDSRSHAGLCAFQRHHYDNGIDFPNPLAKTPRDWNVFEPALNCYATRNLEEFLQNPRWFVEILIGIS